ncbi:hypothetical protein F5Y15DRAFT_426178 [Xylariaceae sp. FL0016]|nr:hypothetical protein F5Y15DRAFT_426178 [Xylariaceae sp. FL0016]
MTVSAVGESEYDLVDVPVSPLTTLTRPSSCARSHQPGYRTLPIASGEDQVFDHQYEHCERLEMIEQPHDSTFGLFNLSDIEHRVLRALMVISTTAVISLVVSVWIIYHVQTAMNGDYVTAHDIGGRVSNTWAKFIDFGSSTFVAPVLIAVTNWYIFRVVRLCILSEDAADEEGPVPLNALVEASATDWGSYSPLKNWTLMAAGNFRLSCVAVISLLMALSFSFLTSIVAYEFKEHAVNRLPQSLDYLYSPGPAEPHRCTQELLANCSVAPTLSLEDFTEYDLTYRLQQSLQEFDDGNLDGLMPNNTYIGQNISQASLDAIPIDVQQMTGVSLYRLKLDYNLSQISDATIEPGYRDDVECEPSSVLRFQINAASYLNPNQTITFTTEFDTQHGDSQILSPGYRFPLIAFPGAPNPPTSEVWIGFFFLACDGYFRPECDCQDGFTLNVAKYRQQLALMWGVGEKSYLDGSWVCLAGFQSIIRREKGTVTLSRNTTSFGNQSSWEPSQMTFEEGQGEVENFLPLLHDLQYNDVFTKQSSGHEKTRKHDQEVCSYNTGSGWWAADNKCNETNERGYFHGERRHRNQGSGNNSTENNYIQGKHAIVNLGSKLAGFRAMSTFGGYDWNKPDKYLAAYLWAEAEARDIMYEMKQTTLRERPSELSYVVEGQVNGEDLYVITFIPWAVLGGVLTMLGASTLTIVLAIKSLHLHSFRTGRVMNSLRLTMDVGAAVDRDVFEQSMHWKSENLERWASYVYVRLNMADSDTVEEDGVLEGVGIA